MSEEKFIYASSDDVLNSLFEVVNDSSTWISECQLSESDKECAVICLAEISGAVRLAKNILKQDEIDFMNIQRLADDEDERS